MGVILTAIATSMAIAAGATGIAASVGAFDRGSPETPTLLPLFEEKTTVAPQVKALTAKTEEDARRESMQRRAVRTKTLLTGPQGALGTATTGKKVLLGA